MSMPAMDPPESQPETIVTFDALPLAPEVRRAVDDLGYVHPTPVQRAVYEPAAQGRDLVVQARTGTGKTAAFGLPIINALIKKSARDVQAVVLCPTRELALQVTREVSALGQHRDVQCVPVYGGAPMTRQVEQLQAGAHIVVGTPGRVLDHLRRGTLDPKSIGVVVLDESDEMLSMGFLPQITDILSYLPQQRQTLLFSATLPPDIRRMAETRLTEPEFITLSGDHIGALEIDHFVFMSYGDKIADFRLALEVEDPESAIIFCNTREQTKRVTASLKEKGYSADWLNADLAQGDREKVMAATRKGELRFLVATDVAARGIDISHLTHVINYDFPESSEVYVHRTGRTGRAGRTGIALSMIAPSDVGNLYMLRLTYKIRPIEKQLPSAQEQWTRAETDVVRSLADLFTSRHPEPNDLSLARRLLTHDRAETIIAGLLRDHLGARPGLPEEAAAARRARRPPPQNATTDEEPEAEPGERASRRTRRRPRSDSEDEADQSEVGKVYVNVGRSDGARPTDILDLLQARAGLGPDQTEYVQVRPRHTFIGLRRQLIPKVVDALNGVTIAGKEAVAEESRTRD